MRLRDRLDSALQDYEDVNLGSQTARDALIDRVIQIVQNEPTDSKYWTIKNHPLEDEIQADSPFNDGWTQEHYKNKIKDDIVHPD